MPTTAANIYSGHGLQPIMDAEDAITIPVNLAASTVFTAGTVLGEKAGTNETQSLTMASATSGTFTLSFGGQTTSAIAWNASAATIQAALWALSTIGSGNIAVTGGPISNSPIYVEFIGTLSAANQAAFTADVTSLTGAGAAVTVATVRNGATGTLGTYAAYSPTATDGSQIARGFLAYDCATDASGNISLASVAGAAEFGATQKDVSMYVSGMFLVSELTGLDTKAVSDLQSRLVNGYIGSTVAIIRIG